MPPKLLLDKSRTLMELALQINGVISPLNLLWEIEKKNKNLEELEVVLAVSWNEDLEFPY